MDAARLTATVPPASSDPQNFPDKQETTVMTTRTHVKRTALAGAAIGILCGTLWSAAAPASASSSTPTAGAGVERKPCNDQEAGTIDLGQGWTYRCSKDGRAVIAHNLNW